MLNAGGRIRVWPCAFLLTPGRLLTGDYLVTYYGRVTDDDQVFKALADPTRRFLLDLLFQRDGRTLTELQGDVEMTRFGVMKHLRLLEAAGLVVTRRSGREKLHFLNRVPIRLLHDRWIDKYTEPWAAGLTGLKRKLEATMEKIYQICIKTTPERLWEAITNSDMRRQYTFGVGIQSDWKIGSPYVSTHTPIAHRGRRDPGD